MMITEKIGKVFFALGYFYIAVFIGYTLFTNTIKAPSPSDVVPVFAWLYYLFLVILLAFLFFTRNFTQKLINAHFVIIRNIMFGIGIFMLFCMAWGNFRNVGGSDAWGNDDAAVNFVQNGEVTQKQSEYYMFFATNYPLLFFNILLVKITGATSANDINYLTLHIVIHFIMMVITMFIAYLIAKRFLSQKAQIGFIALEILFLAIDFRIHDGYNDSFLILIPILLFYIFIKFLENNSKIIKVLLLLAYSLIHAIAFAIRPTILILEVIIILTYFFSYQNKSQKAQFEINPLLPQKLKFSRFLNTVLIFVLTLFLLQVPTMIRVQIVNQHPGLQYRPPAEKLCKDTDTPEECQKILNGYTVMAQTIAGVKADGINSSENKQGSTLGALSKLGLSFNRLAKGEPSPDLKTLNPVMYFVKVNKYLLQDPTYHIVGEPIFTPTTQHSDPLAKFIQTYLSPKQHIDLWHEPKIITLEESWQEQRLFIFYNFLVALWAILLAALLLFFALFNKLSGLKRFVFMSCLLSNSALLFATSLMEINARYLWFFLPLFLISIAIASSEIAPLATSATSRILKHLTQQKSQKYNDTRSK